MASSLPRFAFGFVVVIDVVVFDVFDPKLLEPRAGEDSYSENEPRDAGLTFSTDNLRKRIDIMYLRTDPHASVVSTRITTVGDKGHFVASDHLGLVADFAAPPPILTATDSKML